jgi:hypothetical protein
MVCGYCQKLGSRAPMVLVANLPTRLNTRMVRDYVASMFMRCLSDVYAAKACRRSPRAGGWTLSEVLVSACSHAGSVRCTGGDRREAVSKGESC